MPPILTTVVGTLYAPDGSPLDGSLLISTVGTWISADGFTILSGYTFWVPVVAGIFDVDLVLNQGSVPASTYRVKVETTQGYYMQTWDVPPPGSPPAPVSLQEVLV